MREDSGYSRARRAGGDGVDGRHDDENADNDDDADADVDDVEPAYDDDTERGRRARARARRRREGSWGLVQWSSSLVDLLLESGTLSNELVSSCRL